MLCGAASLLLTICARAQEIASSKPAIDPGSAAADPDNPAIKPGNVPTEPDTLLSQSDSLPALPKGKTTIMGGAIRSFDPVRDQFSLQVYGQRPLKILFDERTQVYRDGVKVSLRNLGPEDHASVQTTLDGDKVFAVSIHILSGSPEGECEGRVIQYEPNTGELEVASSMSPKPVTLFVPAGANIARVGEPGFTAESRGLSDLVAGALISASFDSDTARRNVARQIKVEAVPGASFVFSGNISFLDTRTGIMVLVDPRDGKSYEIRFDSARLTASESLRLLANVTVRATYDGTHYAANTIAMN